MASSGGIPNYAETASARQTPSGKGGETPYHHHHLDIWDRIQAAAVAVADADDGVANRATAGSEMPKFLSVSDTCQATPLPEEAKSNLVEDTEPGSHKSGTLCVATQDGKLHHYHPGSCCLRWDEPGTSLRLEGRRASVNRPSAAVLPR